MRKNKLQRRIEELEQEKVILTQALAAYPHDFRATCWFPSQNNWFWTYVAPILGVQPLKSSHYWR